MNGEYLVDTNIIIALFAGESSVLEKIRNAPGIHIPSIVLGELYYGAFNSTKVNDNIEIIRKFSQEASVLSCNILTASHYGEIKSQLKAKGHPIPENDIWIAALSVQYNLILVTRDSHFRYISTLKTLKW